MRDIRFEYLSLLTLGKPSELTARCRRPLQIGRRNDLAEPLAGGTRPSVPFLNFRRELFAEGPELRYALVNCCEMPVREREDMFTRCSAGTREFQDFSYLLERKP